MSEIGIFAAISAGALAAVSVLFFIIGFPVRQITHHYDVSACRVFHQTSGYETKFVDYAPLSWDCLGKTSDGKWISTKNLHDVNVEPK